MIALDTTALIDLFRHDEPLIVLLKETKGPLAIPMLVLLELQMPHRLDTEEQALYDQMASRLRLLELTPLACKMAGALHRQLLKKGTVLSGFDIAIAASMLAHGVNTIISRDKHFDAIPGLKRIGY